jgi:hypothetical protein
MRMHRAHRSLCDSGSRRHGAHRSIISLAAQ